MSEMAVATDQAVVETNALTSPNAALLADIREKRQNSLQNRREYEPTWHICKSFLAGRQWVGWDEKSRQIVAQPNPQKRERHTVNMIDPYHQTLMGKLIVEDLRPDIIFSRKDVEAESVATHMRQLTRYAWDIETSADRRLYLGINKLLTYGTAGLRCVFDPTQGETIMQVPVINGQPILDPQQAAQIMAMGPREDVQMQDIKEGRIILEPLSPFNILPPPGIEEPDFFPWLMIDYPMSLEAAKGRWPEAEHLKEQDIRNIEGREYMTATDGAPTTAGRLKGHIIVTTYYEMPCPKYPKGRTVIFSDQQLLEVRDELPYKLKGVPHHGITFFRYHLVPGRFWGKGVVEDLIGPQRQLNIARSQMIEMKDRNLGRVYVKGKGIITESNKPVGKIMELIELPMHAEYPQETPGVPLGPWIENEARINMEDIERVAGLSQVSQGQAPTGVSAYAAMQLLAEQDERRVGPVLKEIRGACGDTMLLVMNLIKDYWQEGKRLAIVGEDGMVEEFIFSRTKMPPEFYVSITKNAPMPTSPAAEAQKIFDLYHAAIAAGMPLPPDWLKDSLDAGRALPFPKREEEVQRRKAEMEHYFIAQGVLVTPDIFDDDAMHMQIHRAHRYELEHAIRSGHADEGVVMYIQGLMEHEKMHLENGQAKATGGAVPNLQGGRGIEAQNGQHASMEGSASAASNGEMQRSPRGGADASRPQ